MTNEIPLSIFIGYDERQPEAFEICAKSIEDYASGPVKIHKLDHKVLREAGLFKRPWRILENGQYEDAIDNKPFSTQFSHSRFLVPHLSQHKSRYSVFVDSDFLFFTDIYKLIQHCASGTEKYPVYCVKHKYEPTNTIKMDNCKQVKYNKKLWTSLMVFDNHDPMVKNLTPKVVNEADGGWLHQFKWLTLTPDQFIGSIPESWNFIPNHSEKQFKTGDTINAIHFTEGTPHMEGYDACRYSELYWKKYKEVLKKKFDEIG